MAQGDKPAAVAVVAFAVVAYVAAVVVVRTAVRIAVANTDLTEGIGGSVVEGVVEGVVEIPLAALAVAAAAGKRTDRVPESHSWRNQAAAEFAVVG